MISLRPSLDHVPPRIHPYIEIKSSTGQLVQLFAVLAGLKSAMDDWIRIDRLDAFRRFAREVGIAVRVESRWDFIEDYHALKHVVGGDQLNTTLATGFPADCQRGTFAHVVLGRSTDVVEEAVASGWYELPVSGRRISKPWIDHDRFGELMGYPDCCRRFFAAHNDWNRDNTLYQAWRRTARPDPLTNTLVKNSGLSYACHLPCSFDCPSTCSAASKVRRALHDEAPQLSASVDELLRRPYLVLSEWEAFGFDGTATGPASVRYAEVFAVPTNRQDLKLLAALQAGDALDVRAGVLRISSKGTVIATGPTRADRFGPQMPFIVDFT